MNSNTVTKVSSRCNTRAITMNAMCIALTFLATMCINVRLPIMANGGLIHLGNVPLFLTAILFGRRSGAVAGAVGMALFDLVSGWVAWAPFTFVIVGLMGYVVGAITEKENHQTMAWYLTAILVALVIKVAGYYGAEGILYGNWIAPASSIPGNLMQVAIAGIIVVPLAGNLKRRLHL